MAIQIDLTTHTNNRGNLTVIEMVIPIGIKHNFILRVDDSIRCRYRYHTMV